MVAAYMIGTNFTSGVSLINVASKYQDVYDTSDSTSDYGERNDIRVYGVGI